MRCEECGEDRALTYRSEPLRKRSVCAPCVRLNHPGTLNMSVVGAIPGPDDPWVQTREGDPEPVPVCACGDELPADASPVKMVSVSTAGVSGGSDRRPVCTQCEGEQEHLYALFHGDKFSFCGCGCPEDAYDLVRNILQLCPLFENGESGRRNGTVVQETLGGIDGTFYLVLYAIDSLDLIEHGTSIGGSWLSGKGQHYLPLMSKHSWDAVEAAGLPHDGDECPADCLHWVASYPEYRREAILEYRAQQPPDPGHPIPGNDGRCKCSRTRKDGYSYYKVTGHPAKTPAKADAAVWIDLGCPHHGGLARQLQHAR